MSMSEAQAAAVIAALVQAGYPFPKDAAPAMVAESWRRVLGEYPVEVVRLGVRAWLARPDGGQRWPMPGQIRGEIERQQEALLGVAASPEDAWGVVIDLCETVTSRHPPVMGTAADDESALWAPREDARRARARDWDRGLRWRLSHHVGERHALEAGVRSCGGWSALCLAPTEDYVGLRPAFRESYRARMERERSLARVPELRDALALEVGAVPALAPARPAGALAMDDPSWDMGQEIERRMRETTEAMMMDKGAR